MSLVVSKFVEKFLPSMRNASLDGCKKV